MCSCLASKYELRSVALISATFNNPALLNNEKPAFVVLATLRAAKPETERPPPKSK